MLSKLSVMSEDEPGQSDGVTQNLQELQTNSVTEAGDSWLNLLLSAPATPEVQSPPSPAVEIPQPAVVEIPRPAVIEITSSPSISSGSIPVVGLNKLAKRKRPPKKINYVEVTVVEPPELELNDDADELDQMLSTILEWRKLVADMLPEDLLVPAPRRRMRQPVQKYNPCSWQEFIERTHDEEYRKANARRPKRFKRTESLEGPSDPVGSARDAVVEIYSERFDAAEYGKYNLFDNGDMVSQQSDK